MDIQELLNEFAAASDALIATSAHLDTERMFVALEYLKSAIAIHGRLVQPAVLDNLNNIVSVAQELLDKLTENHPLKYIEFNKCALFALTDANNVHISDVELESDTEYNIVLHMLYTNKHCLYDELERQLFSVESTTSVLH